MKKPASKVIQYFFFDKTRNMLAFKVTSDKDGKLIKEVVIPLLTMHCVTKGISPRDFEILAGADINTEELYKAVGDTLVDYTKRTSVNLSAQQELVLDLVLKQLSNKEIGSKLNITERTVKFHVSRLLGKFRASDRASLKATVGSLIGNNVFAIPSVFKEEKVNAKISKPPITTGNTKLPSRSR